VSLYQQVVGRARLALVALAGAVGFVLLISCANVANLLLARASTRRKELAVRAALGAGRGRMIRQLLAESALLAGLGGSLALLLAFWWVKLLGGVIPDDLPRADQIGVDARVLGFTLAASLLSALLFGLAPALLASRIDLNETLKDGGRASAGGGSPRFRNLLVVCEMALAVALLVGAGLMTRSFVRLMGVDPGLDPRNVLTMEIKLPRGRYASPRQQAAFYRGLLERARALPGVQAASAVYPLPLSGMEDNIGFRVEGLPLPDGEWPAAGPRCVGTDYFKALGIRLLKGRDFNEADGADAPPVVIVNESLARQYWPNQDPVGGRLAFNLHNDGQTVWREVVGVARDVRQRGLDVESRPEIYFPFVQFPISSMALVMRANGDPLNYAAAARAQAQAVDGDQAVSKIHTMEELLETSVSQRRFNLTMLAVFAGLALALAGVRIYGVMAYLVNERAHEIGVRMALGARPAAVLGLVLRRGMSLALTGVALGLLTAFWLTRLIKNLLFGVSASDPLTFTGIALLLLVVAFLACWLPARRAMKVNPIFALRCNG
jgi:putative ABC transport system permease protein